MDPQELAARTRSHLPFNPYPLQSALIESLATFIARREPGKVFLLNGYAGSGKTSIMGALIKALNEMKQKSVTLAPTGRAAKVAADFSGGKASTIHRRIFRPATPEPGSPYVLASNPSRDTVFIVDEASLITDVDNPNQSLLSQLMRYISSAPGNCVILVGDIAQLPPVGLSTAPAMDPGRLRRLGYSATEFTLDIPMRQGEGSGVLYNATNMRQLLFNPGGGARPEIISRGFDDINVISGSDLADSLADSWSRAGVDNTIIITRSNARANRYNQAIRNMVMMAEGPLQPGDRIVISRNDYYWSQINKMNNLIANGDMTEVKWVGKTEKMYGRFFTDVELLLPSSGLQIGAKLMLRSLVAEGPAIPRDEMDRFYRHVLESQEGELSEKIKAVTEDPYFNALQAKYGYCITCHKAQGGQWRHVYVDMSGINPAELDETFYRWFYTAVTRTTDRLFFINPTLPVV